MWPSRTKKSTTFYCFSPPVMVATIVVELLFFIYTLTRYKINKLTLLASLLLVLLATFQLAEFRVCRGSAGIVTWSHIGYVAITALPALGIHLVYTIAGRKTNLLVYLAYLSAAAFMIYFALLPNSLTGHACLGNYVIFQVNNSLTWLYALYYYAWLFIAMTLCVYLANKTKKILVQKALRNYAIGYVLFLAPTVTVNLIRRSTLNGIPSIMCGFAVLFALVLVLLVIPKVAAARKN